jgi:hypothetical protein
MLYGPVAEHLTDLDGRATCPDFPRVLFIVEILCVQCYQILCCRESISLWDRILSDRIIIPASRWPSGRITKSALCCIQNNFLDRMMYFSSQALLRYNVTLSSSPELTAENCHPKLRGLGYQSTRILRWVYKYCSIGRVTGDRLKSSFTKHSVRSNWHLAVEHPLP